MSSPHTELPDGLVLASGLSFPEGPAFAPDGTLWWVELEGGCLTQLRAGEPTRHIVGGKPNGVAFGPGGAMIFCDADANAIRRFDPQDGSTTTVLASTNDTPLDRPNDLAFDGKGRLVFTCPGNSRVDPIGCVWASAAGEAPHLLAGGLNFPNGLAFSADGRTLFVAETYRHRVWRGEYDPRAGAWLDAAPYAELGGPIGPDGLAVGSDGALYAAVFGQGAIKRIDVDGSITVVARPGERPTNCAFDPSGRLGLVVTEAASGQVIAYPSLGTGATLFGDGNDLA